MKRTLCLKACLIAVLLAAGTGSAWAEKYKLTITTSDFSSTSYAANNNEKTSQAVSTTDNTKKYEVKWTSNQVMLQSKAIQFQKNTGYIYNSTDLGTIESVTFNGSSTTSLTTYYGESKEPSSSTTVGGGYFKIVNGNATASATKIEVVFVVPEEVSYTITALSNNEDYGTVALKGNIITATPKTGYRVSTTNAYEVTVGTATVAQDGNSFTITSDADCTVKVNFEAIPTYATTFYANGAVFSTVYTAEDENVVFPAEQPVAMGGKVFVGWVASDFSGTTNTAPAFVTSHKMTTTPAEFYAVYAKVTKGNVVEVEDVLNLSSTGVSGTNYATWSNKKGTSGAVYAGNSAGGNSSIQLRSSGNNSGIVSTGSAGKILKVEVSWNTNSADGRTLLVYGSNTAYSQASDLYDLNKQGKEVGKIVKGTSTTLEIDGDYNYIGFRSSNNALYLNSVTFTWQSGSPDTYSDYCTSLTDIFEIGETGYATYCPEASVSFAGSEVTAYAVQVVGGVAKLTAVETVPAGEGVVLKGAEDIYEVPMVAEADALEGNELKVSDGSVTGGSNIYCLAKGSNGVGFYLVQSSVTIPEGKCYLETASGARQFIGFDADATAIEGVASAAQQQGVVFDLQGRRVAQPTKGLYIVNGKKIVKQ